MIGTHFAFITSFILFSVNWTHPGQRPINTKAGGRHVGEDMDTNDLEKIILKAQEDDLNELISQRCKLWQKYQLARLEDAIISQLKELFATEEEAKNGL